MKEQILVQPLPQKTRQRTFGFLLLIFVVVLPVLYLYASGYRLDLRKPTNFVSTGGISVTIKEENAEMFIDDTQVRAARAFRDSFYAQGVDVGTHRVHVQKEGFHTWVKELPVSERLVTEVIAFNLPIVPQVRVITPTTTATGTAIVSAPLTSASATNPVLATTTKVAKAIKNDEYAVRLRDFSGTTSTSTASEGRGLQIRELLVRSGTTTDNVATTTIVSNGVRLFMQGDDLYASWVESYARMPYYYCAADFARYSTTTLPQVTGPIPDEVASKIIEEATSENVMVLHPVQTVPADAACDPTIRIDRQNQKIADFAFFPGSSDFVIVALETGIYVVEIDDRGWQNVQPLMKGKNLQLHIENNDIYVYDGALIYQVFAEIE